MGVLVEAYQYQYRYTWFHNPRLFMPKLAYLALVALVFITFNPWIYLAFIISGLILLSLIKAYRLILYTLILYFPPTLLIILVDYLAGTLTPLILTLLIYGYTGFVNIVFFYATTPIQQFYDYLGRNPLTLALLMLHNILAELNEAIQSKKARGWEPGWNLYNHFLIVIDAIRILLIRLDEITTALRARGVD